MPCDSVGGYSNETRREADLDRYKFTNNAYLISYCPPKGSVAVAGYADSYFTLLNNTKMPGVTPTAVVKYVSRSFDIKGVLNGTVTD